MTFIKAAEPKDIDAIVEMFIEAAEELSKGRGLPKPNREYIDAHVVKGLSDNPVFMVYEDDKFVGFAAMCFGFHVWSDEPYLTTSMLYLREEHRKCGTIKALYKVIEKYAQLQGLPYIDHYMFNGKSDARRRLLRSLNLKEHGIIIGL